MKSQINTVRDLILKMSEDLSLYAAAAREAGNPATETEKLLQVAGKFLAPASPAEAKFEIFQPRDIELPFLFVDYWKGLTQDCPLKRTVHIRLLNRLAIWNSYQGNPAEAAKFAIPGYETPPPAEAECKHSGRRVPEGWTYSNLIRLSSDPTVAEVIS